MDERDFERLGLCDPGAPDAAEWVRLLRYLVTLGATEAEFVEAARIGSVGGLALDLVMRPPGDVVPFEDAVAQAGLTLEEGAALWRALGFPDPTVAPPRLPADAVDALVLMRGTGELLGDDTALALARVVGATTARLAQAVVDAFRVRVELPQLAEGVPYTEVVQRYGELTRDLLPAFLEFLGAVFRRHLVAVASGTWSHDEERATAGRDLVVGFADLVGYTAIAQTMSPGQLAAAVDRFETVVTETVGRHGGRVVKLIGDGAMFVIEDAGDAVAASFELVDAVEAGGLPPLRVALAAGQVVSVYGDYFGDVVNLAARLLAIAPPSAVVASAALAGRLPASVSREALGPTSLKGLGDAVTAFRLHAG